MYIEHEGEEHKVVFHHVPNPEDEEVRPHTICIITKGQGEDEELLAAGYSRLHPNDVFNKAKGRQISLGKALQQFVSKEDRLAWWTAYATWKTEEGVSRLPLSPMKVREPKVA